MRKATIMIEGLTPYSQSRAFQSVKETKESFDDFDKRSWQEHMHTNEAGETIIPAVAISQGIASAAGYLGKGGELKKLGSSKWVENFRCGLALARSPVLTSPQPARPERVYCNANGERGSGKRVWRTFPIWDTWSAEVVIHILDDSIPDEIFGKVINAFGLFIGVGRYRAGKGGDFGRFRVKEMKITTVV